MIDQTKIDELIKLAGQECNTKALASIGLTTSDIRVLVKEKAIEKYGWGLYRIVAPNLARCTRQYKKAQPKKEEIEVQTEETVQYRPIPESINGEDLTLDLENFYGLDTVWIIDQVLESGVDIDMACGGMNYNEEDTQLAHLIMARKYYTLCEVKKADELLYKVAPKTEKGINTSGIKSPLVKWLAKGIYKNRDALKGTYTNGKHYMLLPTGYVRKRK